MVLRHVNDLLLAAMELGRMQSRLVEFSGILLESLLKTADTAEQLIRIRRIAQRMNCLPEYVVVEQCENFDGIRVMLTI